MADDFGFIEEKSAPIDDFGFVSDPLASAKRKPLKGEGVFPAQSLSDSVLSALSQGALGTILAGTPEAIAARSGINVNAPESAKFQAPLSYVIGETLGGLLPLGQVGKTATGLKSVATQGARLGALYGLGQGVSEESMKPDATVSKALSTGAKDALVGAMIGAAIPVGVSLGGKVAKAVSSPIKTLEDAGIIRTPESIAIDVLNPTGEGAIREAADSIFSGDTLKGFQIIKNTGAFNDLPTLVQRGEETLPKLIKEVDTLVADNPGIKINTSDAAEAMVQRVSQDPLLSERNPEVLGLVEANAENFNKDFSLKEAFDRLKSINKRHKDYFTASAKGQSSKLQDAEFETDEIARKYLSNKLNDAIQGISGLERNPYREYGSVNEIVLQSGKRLSNALVERAKEVSKTGVVSDLFKNFDITRPLASISRPATFLRGGELGRLNRRVSTLNDRLPASGEIKILTEAERTAKLKDKIAVPPLLPEAQAEEVLNARIAQELSDFEKALQFQRETGGMAFAPGPEEIAQTLQLEQQFINRQAVQDELNRKVQESLQNQFR